MAYRRRQGITRSSTFKEEIIHRPPDNSSAPNSSSPLQSSSSFSGSSSLAAQAIRASALSVERKNRSQDFSAYDDASAKSGFWGVLARKAKAILEEDGEFPQDDAVGGLVSQPSIASGGTQFQQQPYYQSYDNSRRTENPALRKGLDRITTSLNQLGDTFEKAFEEGRTIVENKTADIKMQIKRRGDNPDAHDQASYYGNQNSSPLQPKNHDTQLKASRDVAMATAAKAKLLLRELKTVKADLAFAKERCSQLEEENKRLRENRDKGNHRADDDLIRLQLETLLAEKARLANENSVYARENRFLREIVEYHQLTMQDVVYMDDEEVTEVNPLTIPTGVSRMLSISPPSSAPPSPPPEDSSSATSPVTKEISPIVAKPQENKDVFANEAMPSSDTLVPKQEHAKTPSSAGAATKTHSSTAEAATKSPPTAEAATKTVSVAAEDSKAPFGIEVILKKATVKKS